MAILIMWTACMDNLKGVDNFNFWFGEAEELCRKFYSAIPSHLVAGKVTHRWCHELAKNCMLQCGSVLLH